MPAATNASTCARIVGKSMTAAKVFQDAQPIGGRGTGIWLPVTAAVAERTGARIAMISVKIAPASHRADRAPDGAAGHRSTHVACATRVTRATGYRSTRIARSTRVMRSTGARGSKDGRVAICSGADGAVGKVPVARVRIKARMLIL